MNEAIQSAAVIVNPTKFGDDLQDAIASVIAGFRRRGLPVPTVVETTEDDPGYGQTRQVLSDGARLVCALGGDGTVRAVAHELAGTGIPLGLLPGGTGNLLAGNLGAPTDLEDAVEVVCTGLDRRIDAAWAVVDGGERQLFTVMAGMGFDAAMMDDATEGLKKTMGWPAYVVSGAKNLRSSTFGAHITTDNERTDAADIRTVVVGNCGTRKPGLTLFPDALIDDGILDTVVVCPSGVAQWVGAVWTLARGADGADSDAIARSRGGRIRIEVDPAQRVELDGDGFDEARTMEITIDPGALIVRVPRCE